jgi:hypothetical protein
MRCVYNDATSDHPGQSDGQASNGESRSIRLIEERTHHIQPLDDRERIGDRYPMHGADERSIDRAHG